MDVKKLSASPSSHPDHTSSPSSSLPASLCSPLEALPTELLNLIFDSLVLSRCHSHDSCCRNSERCCRTASMSCASPHGPLGQRRCGVREVPSLLLSSRALSTALRSTPSFKALLCSHSAVAGSAGRGTLAGPSDTYSLTQISPEHPAAWVRSLYLKELAAPDGKSAEEEGSTRGSGPAQQITTGADSSSAPRLMSLQCRLLRQFSGLVVLHLPCWFDDSAAAALPALKSLRTLCLRGTSIGDPGLRHVAAIPHLEELDLSSTEVTSDGLRPLVQAKQLRLLNLSFCHFITGPSGVQLQQMKQLQELYLCGTPITDETLILLGGLPRLRKLSVEGCEELSDVGLEVIERVMSRNHARSVRMRDISWHWGRSFMEVTPVLC